MRALHDTMAGRGSRRRGSERDARERRDYPVGNCGSPERVLRLRGEISSMGEALTLTRLMQLSFGHVTDSIAIEAFAR
jgi:hypothetical protein